VTMMLSPSAPHGDGSGLSAVASRVRAGLLWESKGDSALTRLIDKPNKLMKCCGFSRRFCRLTAGTSRQEAALTSVRCEV